MAKTTRDPPSTNQVWGMWHLQVAPAVVPFRSYIATSSFALPNRSDLSQSNNLRSIFVMCLLFHQSFEHMVHAEVVQGRLCHLQGSNIRVHAQLVGISAYFLHMVILGSTIKAINDALKLEHLHVLRFGYMLEYLPSPGLLCHDMVLSGMAANDAASIMEQHMMCQRSCCQSRERRLQDCCECQKWDHTIPSTMGKAAQLPMCARAGSYTRGDEEAEAMTVPNQENYKSQDGTPEDEKVGQPRFA